MLYLDHNATSPMPPELRQKLWEIWSPEMANPSSLHKGGRTARVALEDAREMVATLISRDARGLHFCSGATEASATVFAGIKKQFQNGHILSSSVEHPAVECCLQELEALGFEVTRIRPRADGSMHVDDFSAALREDTRLLSLMWANNETGVLHPVIEIAQVLKQKNPNLLVHSDAVQVLGKMWLEPCPEIDFLSFSGHKIGALSGIGALWKRLDLDWPSFICGGPQEREFRGGTENLLGAISFGLAAQTAFESLDQTVETRQKTRDWLEAELLQKISGILINGANAPRICNTLSFCLQDCRADLLLMGLDLRGIALSSGSACASGSSKASRVLMEMGRTESEARSALRISLGTQQQPADLIPMIDLLVDLVAKQRKLKAL